MARNGFDSSSANGAFVRRSVIVGAVLLLAIFVSAQSCARVDAGHVGIRVRLAGAARGVQDAPVVMGWVAYNPITENIIEFPTSVQNVVWTRSSIEGSVNDESITFASAEGVTVNADVGLAFHIDGEKAPRLYSRFRERQVSVLAHGYVRNAVREALNEGASVMPVQEIYGPGKTRLLNDALRTLNARLSPDGFMIDQLTFTSALRLPENVVGAINRAMEATQNAIQAENRVRQIRAEAEQAVEQARGSAEAARQRARGDADALLIRARAEAQSNEIIRLTTTREVISYRTLERWDGHLPVVNGSGTLPMMTMDTTQILQMPEADRRARLQQLLGAAAASDTPASTHGVNATGPGTPPAIAPIAPVTPPATP